MERVIVTGVTVVVAILALSCAHSGPKTTGLRAELASILIHVESPADTSYVLEMASVFDTVDGPFLRYMLKTAPNHRVFLERVDRWKRNHPEQWARIDSLLTYCRQKGFGPAHEDVRVGMVLTHGTFSTERQRPSKYSLDANQIVPMWIYTWNRSADHPHGISVVCEADPGATYPSRILLKNGQLAIERGPIRPYIRGWLKQSELLKPPEYWLGFTIPAHQLSQLTLDSGVVRIRVDLRERDGAHAGRTIISDSVAVDLRELSATLTITESNQWQFYGVPAYLGFLLPSGSYRAVVSVDGAHQNNGKEEFLFDVPDSVEMSDLMLYQDVVGSGFEPGIPWDDDTVYGVSRLEFQKDGIVNAVIQFRLPESYDKTYRAWLTLTPVTINDFCGSGTVDPGPIESITDLDGNPMYGMSIIPEVLSTIEDHGGQYTLARKVMRSDRHLVTFRTPIQFAVNTGKYVLSCQIADEHGRHILGYRYSVIDVISTDIVRLSQR